MMPFGTPPPTWHFYAILGLIILAFILGDHYVR